MRTNIEIDDCLMAAAMEAGGFRTKREAVEEGLRLIARRKTYQDIRALRGKLRWDDSPAPRSAWELPEPAASQVVNQPAAVYGAARTRKTGARP